MTHEALGAELIAWGQSSSGQTNIPNSTIEVVSIAAGSDSGIALLESGEVVTWGSLLQGQLDPPADLFDVMQVAAGAIHFLALKTDGTVIAWGLDREGCKLTISSLNKRLGGRFPDSDSALLEHASPDVISDDGGLDEPPAAGRG